MEIYVCYIENIPYMIYTNIEKAKEFSNKIKTVKIEYTNIPTGLYVVDLDNVPHIFIDIIDAIYLTHTKELKEFYLCQVNEFQDVDIIELENLFRQPLKFINDLELQYRICNHLKSEESYKEAVGVYNLFGNEMIKILMNYVDKYTVYKEEFKEHFRQNDAIQLNIHKTREEILNYLY